MEIHFQNKEKSKRMQEAAFLKLSPSERVARFFELVYQINQFQTQKPQFNSENFEIILPSPKK